MITSSLNQVSITLQQAIPNKTIYHIQKTYL